MKLLLPGEIATRAALILSNLEQTDYQQTENIDVNLGIFGEPI
jgi:hypothetical protein